jgi:inorganic pyrophosphatase
MEYKTYFFQGDKPISPFHDIPLWVDKSKGIANMVLEIPKGTQPKLEISKEDFLNPIKQDVKNGKLRYVAIKYPFNYGAFPQTWENPATVHPDTKAKGDNDPIDVVDLSSTVGVTGQVKPVKILGTYAMIDEGETDWKLISIDVTDPKADDLNNVSDVEKHFPGLLKATHEWFRVYKIPTGKPPNQFAFNGEIKDKDFAHEIIQETNHFWKDLIKQEKPVKDLNTESHVPGAAHPANDEQWAKNVQTQPEHGADQPLPEDLGKWHFINPI